jgi:hypothetical protein
MSAWIQHVKAYAKKNGVSYKEAMKGASKTYGSGINEDRIKANIAQRKAVAEKRDEAQSFLSNIANNFMEAEQEAEQNEKLQREMQERESKRKPKMSKKQMKIEFMKAFGPIFAIYTATRNLGFNVIKDGEEKLKSENGFDFSGFSEMISLEQEINWCLKLLDKMDLTQRDLFGYYNTIWKEMRPYDNYSTTGEGWKYLGVVKRQGEYYWGKESPRLFRIYINRLSDVYDKFNKKFK